jgi:hypothetical protein
MNHGTNITWGLTLLMFYSFCVGGCAVIQKNYQGNTIPLTQENLNSVNGTYQDYPSSDTSNNYVNRLWFQLTGRGYEKGETDSSVSYQVSLQQTGKNRIIIKLYSGGKQIGKEKILKGKIKDGRFEAFHMLLIPFFPIFCIYDAERIRIGLTSNGIYVDSKKADWGILLVFIGGAHSVSNSAAYSSIK